MKHLTIAWKLREIAALMQLLGESSYKIQAYLKAASKLEELTEDIEVIWQEGRLTEIQGVGKSIAKRIEEFLTHGESLYLRELKERVPEGLAELLDIPGAGPKMARRLQKDLGITNVTELEAALHAKKVRELPGMNSRTEVNLLRAIQQMRAGIGRVLLSVALPLGQELLARLKRVHGVTDIQIVGSTRRFQESVGDLDIIVGTEQKEQLLKAFTSLPECKEVVEQKESSVRILTRYGVQVELLVVSPEHFSMKLFLSTGSRKHVKQLESLAQKRGWRCEYDFWLDETGQKMIFSSEEEIYQAFSLPYIIPELREEEMVIQAAQEGWLPQSLRLDQIRGDLHLHTRWSDGVHSIEEMVEKAQSLGYEYLAVCDHSRSLKIAKGMSLEMLREQIKSIDDLNSHLKGFRILKGIEVDILKDGQLDFPDEVLQELDLVVASIHTGFQGSRAELTQRIVIAMQNPHVDILAHPTGRLILRRRPYPLDMDQIFQAAKETGTVLELNATPDRLDLCDQYLKVCKALGVKVAINSDAHSTEQLKHMIYGVGTARRGWLEKVDVINTYSYEQLVEFLQKDKQARFRVQSP